ncbi:MAG: hypothetical protein ACQEVT_10625 [Pseudomonadota bacterium]|uniref:hypothetical protein n=1 Tax=Roseovarius TaxID=74030 RepID=UPI0022A8B2E4|nr:hypothetical protein [Roseovarius sp. EGI FJ00037]MCZ0813950.1 hypothetical protein [Roseovarius sp. EGI FJ00037]
MDIEKDILLHELTMLREEKARRSRQQFEYVRLSLINVGVLSFFGIFSVVAGGGEVAQKVAENAAFVFALMCVLTVVSITLFLFWIDDALSIAGIDRFLLWKERSVDDRGDVYWFEYRQQLNRTASFRLKKWIFNLAVVLSFVSPPFLFGLFTVIHTMLQIPWWVQLAGGAFFFVLLVTPLLMWRRFSRRLYG